MIINHTVISDVYYTVFIPIFILFLLIEQVVEDPTTRFTGSIEWWWATIPVLCVLPIVGVSICLLFSSNYLYNRRPSKVVPL